METGFKLLFITLMSILKDHYQNEAYFFYLPAINECGLVYDGGLVVGPKFETNDPHVYGAGPCVRYSRRLYAPHRLHQYYCSEDVGEAVTLLYLNYPSLSWKHYL